MYKVIENNKNYDEFSPQYYIVNESKISENIQLCTTYNNYGQQIGCHDAGCYSSDNSSCDWKEGEEENHYECTSINYWNGSNWKSFILEYEFDQHDADGIILDNNNPIVKKILDAFEEYDMYIKNGTHKTEEIDGVEFSNNRYSGFEIATVNI